MSRALGLVGFALAAAAVGALAVRGGPGSDRPTLAPAVELVGRATQTVDRAAAQALGVDIEDERRLGDRMHPLLAARSVGGEDEAYVRAVLAEITPLARKPLVWQAYLIFDPSPNAMAFPGGAIAVTTGLLRTLDAEDELAGVLAHEVAHVELSHGLDAAKYEIVSAKLGAEPLGEVAGWLERTLWRTSFDQSATSPRARQLPGRG
jgi:predicted Zn-dependent protease